MHHELSYAKDSINRKQILDSLVICTTLQRQAYGHENTKFNVACIVQLKIHP